MNMINKEQLLYFFLQGKVSLSQYDYKFMANLQTMMQNNSRVTSNQATLFDNLISKYKKQLIKNGLDKDALKDLPWKTDVVESTPDYTGASVSLYDNELVIKVPFNKQFISAFRQVKNSNFEWDKESKVYRTPFNTIALKIANTELGKYFPTVRFDDNINKLINDISVYEAEVYNPTLRVVNGNPVIIAINHVLGELTQDMNLKIDGTTLHELSMLGVDIDPSIYSSDPRLEFASKRVCEVEIDQIETAISWMKSLGCHNVIIGRGLRTHISQEALCELISKYSMQPLGLSQSSKLPDGVNMLIQHTSNPIASSGIVTGQISKTVVLKNSQPIELKQAFRTVG
jgi:hypothetical protein